MRRSPAAATFLAAGAILGWQLVASLAGAEEEAVTEIQSVAADPRVTGDRIAPEQAEPDTAGGARGYRPAGFVASESAFTNAPIEARLDSLRLIHGDGLPPETIPLLRTDEGPTIALADLARLGGTCQWNPETWRGTFQVDSTRVAFTLDSPIFWVGGEPVQAFSSVRYLAESVRLPLSVIDAVVVPLLGNRCRWDPSRGELVLAAAGSWLTTLSLTGNDSVAGLLIAPVGERSIRLRWDPAGVLLIEVTGPRLPVALRQVSGRVEGIEVAWVRPRSIGFEVALRLDPHWAGVRLRGEKAPGSLLVELTAQSRDVRTGRYQALGSYLPVSGGAKTSEAGVGRRVLIEVSVPPPEAGLEGDCLVTLGNQLRQILQDEFGHTVIAVPDRGIATTLRSPAGLPETPGLESGDCWVGLRLESHGSGENSAFLLVVPRPAPRYDVLSLGAMSQVGDKAGGSSEGLDEEGRGSTAFVRVPYWGQVARLEGPSSVRLARTIADHLDYKWADRPVRIAQRPARIFRGVAVPAVLVYPASADDSAALRALCDSTQTMELSRNLAFAIDEFLLTRGREW